jgi:hypothetical protein
VTEDPWINYVYMIHNDLYLNWFAVTFCTSQCTHGSTHNQVEIVIDLILVCFSSTDEVTIFSISSCRHILFQESWSNHIILQIREKPGFDYPH